MQVVVLNSLQQLFTSKARSPQANSTELVFLMHFCVMKSYYIFLLIAAFSLKRVALLSLKNDQGIVQTSHFSFKNPQNNLGDVHDIPEFLVKMYLKNAKNDGTLKGNSKRIPPTVHGFVGKGNARFLALF